MKPFKISQGNLTTITDTILADCAPVDLTGATVAFVYQGPGLNNTATATVGSPSTSGKVAYKFTGTQTAVAGNYAGQWVVTDAGGGVTRYPQEPFVFEIVPSLPVPLLADFSRLSDFYDDIRAVTGDFNRNLYNDAAIGAVMRVHLRSGKVRTDGQRWRLAADGVSITPVIGAGDCLAYGLLVYNTARSLVAPNQAAYNYRTRALSERFGEQKDFMFILENTVYGLENGEQAWGSITGLRSWLFSLNGIWAWSYFQAEQMIDLSFK